MIDRKRKAAWKEHQRDAEGTRKERGKNEEIHTLPIPNPYPNPTAPNIPGNNLSLTAPNSRSQRAPARVGQPGDGGFSRFWDAYPRKTGDIQRAATEYLIAIDDGAKLEDMLQALEWQRNQDAWTEQGGRFIPSPERWLHNRGWTEQKPPEPQGKNATGSGTPKPKGAAFEISAAESAEKLEHMRRMYAKLSAGEEEKT